MSDCLNNKDEDSDSGLVEDVFDVLPDEETLALEDYDDLDLDLSEDNFGCCSSISDYSDLLELDESSVCSDLPGTLQTNFATNSLANGNVAIHKDNDDHIDEESRRRILVAKPPSPMDNNDKECIKNGGKLVSFSKEQARQWRRKRILKCKEKPVNVKEKTVNVKEKNCPTKLQPLLPLPKELKPVSCKPKLIEMEINNHEKIKAEDKLADPLLGGEKMSTRTRRGPMPMKLRALPESFWKEPHSIQSSSLARSNYSVLPPLFSDSKESEVMNVRPVTPPDERGRSPRHSPRNKKKWVMTSPPDTELLFSLFDHLEDKVDERLIVKRGRPKKCHVERVPLPPTRTNDEDPCIVNALATKLFPELSLNRIPGSEEKNQSSKLQAVIRIGKGVRSVEFPAIQAKENYPAILNELVTHM